MAEGGGDEKGENPFSFKKFVKKQNDDPNTDSSEDGGKSDHLDLPDISVGAPTVKEKAAPPAKDCKQADANPFSFKKFLQGGSAASGRRGRAGGATGPGSLATLDLANDLPDFVQGRDLNAQSHGPGASSVDSSLPDFALDSHGCQLRPNDSDSDSSTDGGPSGRHNVHLRQLHVVEGEGNRGAFNSRHDQDGDDEEEEEDRLDAAPVMCTANSTGGLPDFLSDSALGCAASSRGITERNDDSAHRVNGFLGDLDSRAELQRLRDENRELKRELNEARELADTESKRVAGVLGEMEAIQKREAEENKALENMILQVESNLQTTTQRAVKAENTISKLKQDIKALQVVKDSLQSENAALRGGQGGHDPVREKTKYASEQLAAAAKSAEQTLKQLMGGVDTIKLVSDVLASIDKITDATECNTDSKSAGGATGGSS